MAIAYDATSFGSSDNNADASFSHTCTGSNRLLIVVVNDNTTAVTAVTYNGVSLTKAVQTSSPAITQIWYLVAPATGSNTVVVTGNGSKAAVSLSYTGVSQTSPIDSNNTASGTDPSTSLTYSTTVVGSGCWLVGAVGIGNSRSPAAGTGTTQRNTSSSADQTVVGSDSNGTVSTGSQSLQTTYTSSNGVRAAIVSIAPVATTGGNFLMFM